MEEHNRQPKAEPEDCNPESGVNSLGILQLSFDELESFRFRSESFLGLLQGED